MRRLMGIGLAGAALLTACAGGGSDLSLSASTGEQIYFTGTNASGQRLTYSGGPSIDGMGMMSRALTCAACHGADGRGGQHVMHMQVMDAPDIRWAALTAEADHEAGEAGHTHAEAEYTLETFRLAVVEGQHPDGQALDRDMPRWRLDDDDLADLKTFLQSLP